MFAVALSNAATVPDQSNPKITSNETILFSVLGDMPYGSSEISEFQDQVDDINTYTASDFFVHVGDILAGSESCEEDRYIIVADILKSSTIPAFIIPGDNETSDCSNPSQGMAWWLEHLLALEGNFECVPPVERQSQQPENFAFVQKGMLFIGIHLVGGGNSSTVLQRDAEWVTQQLQEKKSQVRGAVIFAQAKSSGSFTSAFESAAVDFGKPILYIHGDGHSWSQESPYLVSNVMRVQVDNGGGSPPVVVTATLSNQVQDMFVFDRDAFSGARPYDRPPCGSSPSTPQISISDTEIQEGNSGTKTASFNVTLSQEAQSSVTVDYATSDGSARAGSDYVAKSGSLTFSTGTTSRTISVTIQGDQEFEEDEFFYVDLSNAGNATLAVSQARCIIRNDDQPVPNEAPVALDDQYDATEDLTLSVGAPGVLGNDDDADGNTLSAAVLVGPASGSLSLSANGSFTYTPNANYNGVDSFSYSVSDGLGGSDVATVTIDVLAVNDAPLAADDSYTVEPGGELQVAAPGVLDNDEDVDGDVLSASLVRQAVHGTASVGLDGSLTYTPDAGHVGADSFDYLVSDSRGETSQATVQVVTRIPDPDLVTFNPIADALVRSSSPSNNYGSDDHLRLKTASTTYRSYLKFDVRDIGFIQGATLRLYVVDANDIGGSVYRTSNNYEGTDTAWEEGGIAWENAPALVGTALSSVSPAPMDTWVEFDVTSAVLAEGIVSFGLSSVSDNSVRYSSKEGAHPPQLVIATQLSAGPLASDDAYEVDEDVTLNIVAPGVLENDVDRDGSGLSAELANAPQSGTVTVHTDGSCIYQPDENFNGEDRFTYTVTDGRGGRDTATVLITVNPTNDLPVTVADSYSVQEGDTLRVAAPGVMANDSDPDGDQLTASQGSGTSHGVLDLRSDGSFTYIPDGSSLSDAFSYTVSDGHGGSRSGQVTITVFEANQVPIALNDDFEVDEDMVLTVSKPGVLGNDSDPDQDLLKASLSAGASHGVVDLQDDGSFSYVPETNFNGEDSFAYVISDGRGGEGSATVRIVVAAVDDRPVAMADSWSVEEGLTLDVSAPGVLGNDLDVEGSPLSATLSSSVSNGVVTLEPDGAFSYSPNPGFLGVDTFSYKASDGALESPEVEVSISVHSAAPTVVTLAPIADAMVKSTSPTSNYGSRNELRLKTDRSSYRAFLKFDLSGVGSVQRGTLRLYVTDPDEIGGSVHLVSTNYNDGTIPWEENGITWDNAPIIAGAALSSVTAANAGTWVEFDVGAAITGQSILSLGLLSESPNSVRYSSKEGANPPELVLETSGGGVPGNAAPVAGSDLFAVLEDDTLQVAAPGVLANDSDADDGLQNLSVALMDGPSQGSVTLQADGSLSYVPNAHFNGSDSFTYTVSDGRGGSDSGSVEIEISPVNDPPSGSADTYFVQGSEVLMVPAPGVLENDSDVDGDELSVVLVDPTLNGTLTMNSDGSFTYSPLPEFTGTERFSYKVTDGTLQSHETVVTLNVGERPSEGPITLQQNASGGSSSSADVSTLSALDGAPGGLYLAAISSKPHRDVVAVTGLGLAWSRVRAQCSGRNQTGVEVWMATGAATSGVVSASFADAPNNATIIVSHYSGADASDPIGDVVSGNTNGPAGDCSGGSDGASYSFAMSAGSPGAIVFGAVAMRSRDNLPGPGFTEHLEIYQGSGGSISSLATVEKSVEAAGAVLFEGSFDSAVDWAAVGLEIRPQSVASKQSAQVVKELRLYRNYPNPFKQGTSIEFDLPQPTQVGLTIYNARGQRVRRLLGAAPASGRMRVYWDGKNDDGNRVGTGVYFLRLELEGRVLTRKLLLQR